MNDDLRKAVEQAPEDTDLRYKLVSALVESGKAEEALPHLRYLVRQRPEDSKLQYNLGWVLQSLGRRNEALDAFQVTIGLQPDHAEAHYSMGLLYQALGDTKNAVQYLENAFHLQPDNQVAEHMLSALKGEQTGKAPAGFVRSLFDHYADRFDTELVGSLGYKVPALLANAIRERTGSKDALDILDLGCGTGLFGQEIRPLGGRLVGVDLSPGMLGKAASKGIYDELVERDIVDFLREGKEGSFHVVAAADAFEYIGELGDVFRETRRVLREEGVFAFSVEAAQPAVETYVLTPTGRYQHAVGYLETLAGETGFAVLQVSRDRLREEHGLDVPGYIAVLRAR